MKKEFRKPDFKERDIELRFEEGEICIYATPKGLETFIHFCNILLSKSKEDHLHLEDYEVLTQDSLIGTIAIFPPS